jgi:hypothetical protein
MSIVHKNISIINISMGSAGKDSVNSSSLNVKFIEKGVKKAMIYKPFENRYFRKSMPSRTSGIKA